MFFVPKKAEIAILRASDFRPTPALLRGRSKLASEIITEWQGTSIAGEISNGHVSGFPRGELSLATGFLAWSLHGVEDTGFAKTRRMPDLPTAI